MASSNFSWAASPPSRTAAATQCSRWSFSRAMDTALRALVTAEIWVMMSMQYSSCSTMRAIPRACPSISRSRRR